MPSMKDYASQINPPKWKKVEFTEVPDTPPEPDVEPWNQTMIRDQLHLMVSVDVPVAAYGGGVDEEDGEGLFQATKRALELFDGKSIEMQKRKVRYYARDDTSSHHEVYELVISNKHHLMVDQWLYQAGRIVLGALQAGHAKRVLAYRADPAKAPLSVTQPGREYTTRLVYSNGQCEYLHISDEETTHA